MCYANNSAGKESVKVTLEVTASLTAHVQPLNQVVDVGKRASFQCIVGGHPVSQVCCYKLFKGNHYQSNASTVDILASQWKTSSTGR